MVASYYHFDVEIHSEFPGRVAISECEIVGGAVRDFNLVTKLKILFPSVFVGDSQEFMLMKISRYTVHESSLLNPFHTLVPFSLPLSPPSSPSLLFSPLH